MKILVTGAAGFIGSHLCERLVGLGHEVVGLDAYTPYYDITLKELNAQDVEAKGVKIHKINLVTDDISPALEGVEVIYHLAAQPGISAATPFEDYLENNIIATKRLLEAIEKSKPDTFFINIATSSVYGKDATKTEEEATEPASYYGVTKLAAEQLVMAANRDKDISACSLRLFSVYGERERPEKLYPRVYRSLFTEDRFPYYEGSEHHIRSYTYVGDIIDGFVAVLDHLDVCDGQIFNIGLDKTMTTGEALETVEKVTGLKCKFDRKEKRPGDQKVTSANIDKARKLLNYNPDTLPEEGFKKTVEWYKEKILPLVKEGKI